MIVGTFLSTIQDWASGLREEVQQADVLLVVPSPSYAVKDRNGEHSGSRAVTSDAAVISELVRAAVPLRAFQSS